MNISDLSHLEVISEESIRDMLGAGSVSGRFSTLVTAFGPNNNQIKLGFSIITMASDTVNSLTYNLTGKIITF